jgi:hypothetical protein
LEGLSSSGHQSEGGPSFRTWPEDAEEENTFTFSVWGCESQLLCAETLGMGRCCPLFKTTTKIFNRRSAMLMIKENKENKGKITQKGRSLLDLT